MKLKNSAYSSLVVLSMVLAGCGSDSQSPGNDGGVGPNRAPFVANGIADQTLYENYPYFYRAGTNFGDPDGEALTYSAEGLPPGLSIDPNTGEISGQATGVGTYPVVLTVTDASGEMVTDEFDIILEANTDPEVSTPIPDQQGTRGQSYTLNADDHFSDAEGGALTYSAAGLPAGLAIDPDTGVISGQPLESGDFPVTITATDLGGATTDQNFDMSIAEPTGNNQTPQAGDPIEDQNAVQNYPFALETANHFNDPDGDQLTYSASGLPAGMSIDPQTGVISGASPDVGTFPVEVKATDPSGAAVIQSFDLTLEPNDSPQVVNEIPDQTTSPNAPFELNTSNSFADPEGGPLTYSATGLPDGMSIDPQTGVISGSTAVPGTYPIVVTATDPGGASVNDQFDLVVDAGATEPTVSQPIPDQSVNVGEPTSLDTSAHFNEPQGQPLTYSATGLPDGLSIDPNTGLISGTPTTPGNYPVVVTATDPDGNSISDDFSYNISPDGSPQLVAPLADQQATQNYPTTIATAASFSDPEGQPLTYSATGLPDGMSIDPATGEITGAPTTPGDYTIVVTATDPDGNAISDDFDLTVNPNQDPALDTPIDDQSTTTNSAFQLNTADHFSDPEGGALTYSASGLPVGMSIDPSTGEITGSTADAGGYTVVVTATDLGGASVSDDFNLEVVDGGSSPTVREPNEDQEATQDYPYTYDTSPAFEDPNGLPLTYSAAGLPPGLDIDPATGVISGTPDTPGDYNAVVTATNPNGDRVSDEFDYNIGANSNPVLESEIPDQDVRSAEQVNFDTSQHFSDAEGGDLTYSAQNLPANLMLDPNTGVISGTSTLEGTHDVIITATDPGGAQTTDEFQLVIFNSPIANDDLAASNQDLFVTINVLENDVLGTGLALTVSDILVAPQNGTAQINSDNTVTYTPAEGWFGDDFFEYEIGDGLSSSSARVDVVVIPGRIIFRSNQELNTFQLYTANAGDNENPFVTSPAPTPLVPTGVLAPPLGYALRADQSEILFVSDQNIGDAFELWKSPFRDANNGANDITQLSPALFNLPTPQDDVTDFVLHPDGQQLIYGSDEGNGYEGRQLWLLDIDVPGVAERVTPSFDNFLGQDITAEDDYKITADGGAVLYRANADDLAQYELFMVRLNDLGTHSQISAQLGDTSMQVVDFLLTPDSSATIYRADANNDEQFELFYADLAGTSAPQIVSGVMGTDRSATESYKISPDGNWLVYMSDQDINDRNELFLVDLSTLAAPIKLSHQIPLDSDVKADFEFSSDSSRIFYRADGEANGRDELYMVEINNPERATLMNDTLMPALSLDPDVENFALSPDGIWLVYSADQETATRYELYLIEIANPTESTKLNAPLATLADIEAGFEITMDSNKVVYRSDANQGTAFELMLVDFDFPERPFKISQTMTVIPDVDVVDFQLIPPLEDEAP